MEIRRALISVYDKKGIVDLARGLADLGVEILSTGGTAKLLKSKEINVKEVSEVTGFPEILSGRVKTLHPLIHGGILFKRKDAVHQEEVKKFAIPRIDMVVVNLYPFREVVSKPGVEVEEALGNIDIGGPTMIRAAAKNFPGVIVLVDAEDYLWVLKELGKKGDLSFDKRRELAEKAFAHTASYDIAIARYFTSLRGEEIPPYLLIEAPRFQDLRYGENPHQKSTFYSSKVPWKKKQGKEISYNNLLDMDAVMRILRDFSDPTAVVIKHTNPCGLASDTDIYNAYVKAREADSVSAFGSVVGVNRPVDQKLAKEIVSTFVEVIIAPSFSANALKEFATRPSLRAIEWEGGSDKWEVRSAASGFLYQAKDLSQESVRKGKVVSNRLPEEKEWDDLEFAWKVAKHVKSNAIVIVKDKCTVGIGAGQMSRVDAVKIAIAKGGDKVRGGVLASDAFFPFPDSIEAAAKAGITAIVEPGGAKRDEECIRAADQNDIAMVFTGKRHFRH